MTPDQIRQVGVMRRLAANGAARELRRRQAFSLRELALVIGTNASTLSRWETGRTRPRASSALRWAKALDVQPERAA
jgi:transcriptional regulator with XRE-family HTH domain